MVKIKESQLRVVETTLNLIALKLINKLLGALFALVKIGLILSVFITIIESYDSKINFIPKESKEGSILYKPLLEIANIVLPEIEQNNLFQKLKSSSLVEIE